MSNNLWAVLFDVDGTMVDNLSFHEQAWIELGRRYDTEITPEMYRTRIHSRPNDENVRFVFGDTVSDTTAKGLSDEKETIYRDLYRPVLRAIDGLVSLLEELNNSGTPCGAVSNSPSQNVSMVLEELQIAHTFQLILDRSHVTRGKPDPEILLLAAREIGIPPAHCVLIEDSISGFKAAEAASMPLVVISAGADPAELHQATNARAVHRDFTTLSVGELRQHALQAEPTAAP